MSEVQIRGRVIDHLVNFRTFFTFV